MFTLLAFLKGLPLLSALAYASADYPDTPLDLTTPVQQRLAVSGANGRRLSLSTVYLLMKNKAG